MYRVILGLYWDYIGIMEKKMETTIVYRGYTGIMEKNMETRPQVKINFSGNTSGCPHYLAPRLERR